MRTMHLVPSKVSLQARPRAFQPAADVKLAARRPQRVRVVAAAAAAEAPAAPAVLRKYMMKDLGWDEAWVDTIVGEIKKRRLPTTPATCEAAVRYLESVGIPSASVCNMVSISKDILAADVDSQLRPVVDFIQRQGITGKALISLLEVNPGLLTYTVSQDGRRLEKGRARASVEIRNGMAGVFYYREGAAFETAPVAPLAPQA